MDRFDLEIVVRAEGSTLAGLGLATPALARGTIEEKTRKLQQAKAELARSTLTSQGSAVRIGRANPWSPPAPPKAGKPPGEPC